ncbi:uncharacterized mitochondrial protein AtMg00860-like [Juglans microcarpa x Juglans regia]|uniref:uncharacterized mitochondrial protein AtMg00860-like n=1 Tax=Juglans microcarpa x Juglans regia TaxID=2249226 RepID=UPI001B7E25C0|nr:uncharacterized mitochondrial protein AtMg00860-like [Juglans microcarpa x Juglans regia]
MDEHVQHLRMTLEVLKKYSLLAKHSKCRFATTKVSYLGHLISVECVRTDLYKLAAMVNWPFPKTLKSLRGFLRLTGYYKRFIKGYGSIATLLTQLLKKNQFFQNEEAKEAFQNLKRAVTQPPVLALPNFPLPFCNRV